MSFWRPLAHPSVSVAALGVALAAALVAAAPVRAQALLHTLASPNESELGFFGISVSGVPDVDGGGRGDLLVGACCEEPDTSPNGAGRVYVFSGASGVLL